MRLNLLDSKKKSKLIILIITFITFVSAGGYLLWKVNQSESVAPEDSMAAPEENIGPITPPSKFLCDGILVDLGHATHLCNPSYRYGQWVCGTNCMSDAHCNDDENHEYLKSDNCPDTREFTISNDNIVGEGNIVEGRYTITGLIGRGHSGQTQTNENFEIAVQNGRTDDTPIVSTAGNTSKILTEGVDAYWEGEGNLGTFYLSEGSNTVVMNHTYDCTGLPKTAESVHLYKFCLKEVNICEPGSYWTKDPGGTHEYGTLQNPIVVEVSDADGLGDAEVTLDKSGLPECETELEGGLTKSIEGVSCYGTDKVKDEISIYIAPGQRNIPSGTYNLAVSWNDGKGIGGSNCELSSTFTIKEEVSDPVCDGGEWNSGGKPLGVYPYCSEIDFSFDAWDSDGVDKDSIAVKVNEDFRVSISKTTIETGDKRIRVEDTLSTETSCLEPGEYSIDAEWADKEGATGPQCTLTTTFTVLEEIKNPDWDITKTVVEFCIDENTENPKSRLEYTITIENKGEGVGEIISVTDMLDEKVLEEYLESVSNDGIFEDGSIVWNFGEQGLEFESGQTTTLTHSYIVPDDAFGSYENTVEAVPTEGETLIANASITADCVILEPEEEEEVVVDEEQPTVPETGIFDEVQSSVLVGLVLLLLGFTWRILGRGIYISIFVLSKFPRKLSIHFKDVKEDIRARKRINLLKKREQNRKKFEKKLVKD